MSDNGTFTALVLFGLAGLGFLAFVESRKTGDAGGDDSTAGPDPAAPDQPTTWGKQSPAQLAQWAKDAGFSGNDLVTAVAVALGESSGDPNAVNPADPHGGSVGLWQINGIHGYNADDLTDPGTNADAAFSVFQSQGWHGWGAYTNGSYTKYLNQAQQAVDSLG